VVAIDPIVLDTHIADRAEVAVGEAVEPASIVGGAGVPGRLRAAGPLGGFDGRR
jgi:hypothetical protein